MFRMPRRVAALLSALALAVTGIGLSVGGADAVSAGACCIGGK